MVRIVAYTMFYGFGKYGNFSYFFVFFFNNHTEERKKMKSKIREQVNHLRILLEKTAHEIYSRGEGMHIFPGIERRIHMCWDALTAKEHTRKCVETGVEMDASQHAIAPYVRRVQALEKEAAWIIREWLPVFRMFFPDAPLPVMYNIAPQDEAA